MGGLPIAHLTSSLLYLPYRHADEAHELSLQNLAQLEMRIFELEICFNKVS